MTTFWQDRPTLVTGATGLVGSWLVRRLIALGAEPVCLVRDWVPQSELVRAHLIDECRVVRGDVRDLALLQRILGEYEIRTVLHLAAQTIVPVANRDPVSTFEANIGGTWAVLEACRRSPLVSEVVVASSDKAYGEQAVLPYSEQTPLQGRFPYDVSKTCADLIAQSYAATYDLPVAITRCGNFYGGGDLNWSRIVPGTIRAVIRGEPPVIRSDGSYIRDYFYVEDGAIAYTHLAEQLAANPALHGQAFNFSYESPISVMDLVTRILQLMEASVELQILGEASHEILEQYLDASYAKNALGWRPLFGLDDGLQRAIEWYRRHLASPSVR